MSYERMVIVSGPSGSGKSTLAAAALQRQPIPLIASVSATTRPPREGEVNGVAYHFITKEEFERRLAAGEFLEAFQVFGGGQHWYGTLKSEVESANANGKWILLEIDIKGGLAVIEQYPEATSIFVRPTDVAEIERRLRGRGTESEDDICRRLDQARQEIEMSGAYRFEIINDDLDRAVDEICTLLKKQSIATEHAEDDTK